MATDDVTSPGHIARLRDEGLTWAQIAEETGLHPEAARGRWRRLEEAAHWRGDDDDPEPEQGPVGPTYLEAWEAEMGRREDRPEWRELVEHAKHGAEIQLAYRPNPSRATRRIVTDGPVFVALPADFHLGSPYTDYEAFVATTDLILGDDRFYISVVGPDMETAFAWFRSADAALHCNGIV